MAKRMFVVIAFFTIMCVFAVEPLWIVLNYLANHSYKTHKLNKLLTLKLKNYEN